MRCHTTWKDLLHVTLLTCALCALGAAVSASDGYLAVCEDDPMLDWNTFMGSSNNDDGNAIAVYGSNAVYVTGSSWITWGAPINPFQAGSNQKDAFVAKLDITGHRQWNTFMGSCSNDDGNGIAVDSSGNVYVVGTSGATWGSPKRTFSGSQDAFVAKLSSSGALAWMTFLGGANADSDTGIAVDGGGNVYVVGQAGGTWGSPIHPFIGVQMG